MLCDAVVDPCRVVVSIGATISCWVDAEDSMAPVSSSDMWQCSWQYNMQSMRKYLLNLRIHTLQMLLYLQQLASPSYLVEHFDHSVMTDNSIVTHNIMIMTYTLCCHR